MSRAPNLVHSLAGGLLRQPPQWLSDQCGGAIAAVVEQRDELANMLDMVDDRLDPSDAKPVSLPSHDEPEALERNNFV